MKRMILAASAAIALGMASGAVWAQPAGGPGGPGGPGDPDDDFTAGPQQMFERFDANHDGQITREEVEAYRASRFADMDANGDGAVTFDEMQDFIQARRAQRAQDRFNQLDANGDGVIDKNEMMQNQPMFLFDRFDRNGDGVVTMDEVPQRPMGGGGPGGPGDRPNGQWGGNGPCR